MKRERERDMGVTAEKRREGAEIITEKREHKIRIRISRLAVESRLLRLPVGPRFIFFFSYFLICYSSIRVMCARTVANFIYNYIYI